MTVSGLSHTCGHLIFTYVLISNKLINIELIQLSKVWKYIYYSKCYFHKLFSYFSLYFNPYLSISKPIAKFSLLLQFTYMELYQSYECPKIKCVTVTKSKLTLLAL